MGKLHADELDIDADLVRRLVAAQFPQWAGLPVTPLSRAGTETVLYRLGTGLVVRLHRMPGSATGVEQEHRWLRRLAAALPLPIPVPVDRGGPADRYPQPWSVYRWLPGDDAYAVPVTDLQAAARDLGRFVAALRRVDPTGAPRAYRGGPLARNDAGVRAALAELDHPRADALAAAWEAALAAPAWDGPPMWTHGDLLPSNLLVRDGRLSAVLDFSCAGVGDPACDMMAAWTVLTPGTRALFRAEVDVDDASWARGRGWALCMAIVALPYYRDTNPVLVGIADRTIEQVLAELA